MFSGHCSVLRRTATGTTVLITGGAASGLLLWGCLAANGAVGTVQVSNGAVGAGNVFEHLIASVTFGIMFPVPINFGAVNPTITIAGTAVAYIYYQLI